MRGCGRDRLNSQAHVFIRGPRGESNLERGKRGGCGRVFEINPRCWGCWQRGIRGEEWSWDMFVIQALVERHNTQRLGTRLVALCPLLVGELDAGSGRLGLPS